MTTFESCKQKKVQPLDQQFQDENLQLAIYNALALGAYASLLIQDKHANMVFVQGLAFSC